MFEDFYGSFWQHPLLLWLFPVLFLLTVRPRGGFFRTSVLVFAVLTIVDPLMTGPITAAMGWSDDVANAVMIFFVLLGDYRFFYFVEHYSRGEEHESRSLRGAHLSAFALTFIVPLTQAALIRGLPGVFSNVRYTFLAYELLFLLLALAFRFVILPRRSMSAETRKWLYKVCGFAQAYYLLWASADVIILSGYDIGFAVRVIPNVLYYGLFIPYVYWTAPDSIRQASVRRAQATSASEEQSSTGRAAP